jgi:hypothetical protein
MGMFQFENETKTYRNFAAAAAAAAALTHSPCSCI